MTAMVALLRGINVGGRGKLPMARLREIVEGCGYTDVATYIQSGNVVLRARRQRPARVAATLAEAIAAGSDVSTSVVVRTVPELEDVVAASPFLARGEDPAHVHVVFLGPDDEPDLPAEPAAFAPDEAVRLVEVPTDDLPRFFQLPPEGTRRKKQIIILDNVIRFCLDEIFKGFFDYDEIAAYAVKLTRDAEYDLSDQLDLSLVDKMSDGLKQRLTAMPVRFVYEREMPAAIGSLILRGVPAMLGAAYVLEGSRLGGALLRRSLPAGLESSFLGVVDSAAWQRLLALLDEHLQSEEEIAAATRAAREVFALFDRSGRVHFEDE